MATLIATVSKDGIQAGALQKLLEARYGEDAVSVVKQAPPARSRAERLSEAESKVEDARSEVESLRDELQDWYDNLPENFQNGSKGDELQTAIDALEELAQALEEGDWSVNFPVMFG